MYKLLICCFFCALCALRMPCHPSCGILLFAFCSFRYELKLTLFMHTFAIDFVISCVHLWRFLHAIQSIEWNNGRKRWIDREWRGSERAAFYSGFAINISWLNKRHRCVHHVYGRNACFWKVIHTTRLTTWRWHPSFMCPLFATASFSQINFLSQDFFFGSTVAYCGMKRGPDVPPFTCAWMRVYAIYCVTKNAGRAETVISNLKDVQNTSSKFLC